MSNDSIADPKWDKLKQMHQAQIEILQQFVKICEAENLTYFMIGGTLLGAVRHKGFIPWDDDVDIALPRQDHEKFLEAAPKYLSKDFLILSYPQTEGYMYFLPRMTNEKVQVQNDLYGQRRIEAVSIDVFPLDGIPEKGLKRIVHEARVMIARALYKISVLDSFVAVQNAHRTWYEALIIFVCKVFHLQKLLSTKSRLEAYNRVAQKYPYEDSTCIMNYYGAYKFKEAFPKTVFEQGTKYTFEQMRLYGPRDADAYLRKLYGDYMQLPPDEDKNKHMITDLTPEGK